MSRGAGQVQELLIDIIGRRGPNLPLPTLVWSAAEEEGVLAAGDLPEESYKRLHAAARRLTMPSARGAVIVREESAATFDELFEWYPDRTKDGTVRLLRRQLMPLIPDYTHSRAKSFKESEEYVLHRRQNDQLSKVWPAAEDALIKALIKLDADGRSAAIELLARGRSLILPSSRVHSEVSLLSAIQRMRAILATERSSLDRALAQVEVSVPLRAIEQARLRTMVAAVTNIGKHESAGLKDAFKRYLLRKRPDVLRALDGHFELRRKRPWGTEPSVQYDPRLDQLVLRDSLRRFPLYSLAPRRHSPAR